MGRVTTPIGESRRTSMITYGSLFSGVGGFDLGCDAAGWSCAWQVEWDKKCQSVLARHWPDVARYEDVRDVRGMDIPLAGWAADGSDSAGTVSNIDAIKGASNLLDPVDCITFGFPCQDLSIAGQRKGLDGERSGLFFEAIRIIREMREATNGTYPRVALVENVVGLLNADGGSAMARCIDALAEAGALVIEWRVLDAQWFGIPQRRRRVFIVAIFDPRADSGQEILSESAGVCWHSATLNKETTRAADSIESCSGTSGEPERSVFVKAARPTSKDGSEPWQENRPAPTLNLFDNGSDSRATIVTIGSTLGRVNALTASFGTGGADAAHGEAGWLIPDRTGTVTTTWAKGPGNTQVEEGHIQAVAEGVRRLTPRECERLMGWPDDHTRWSADGKEIADSNRYRMCGNGVAAPVAHYVATCINLLLKETIT